MRYAAAILSLLLLLSLTACRAPRDHLPESAVSSGTSAEPEEAEDTAPVSVRLITGVIGPNSETASAQGYYRLLSKSGYSDSGCNLFYTDLATCTEHILCSVPGCAHSGETCPAWFPISYGMLFMNSDHTVLYCIGNTEAGMSLWRMHPDGSARTLVYQCRAGKMFSGAVASDGENLYLGLNDRNRSYPDPTMTLLCIREREGAVTKARYLFPYDVTSSLFSAFDNVLAFSKAAGEEMFGCELYDLSTGERREIRCGNGEVFSGRFLCASASGELLYLFEYTAGDRMNVLEFDMRTGEVRLLNDTLPYFGDDCVLVTGIWDGKLCVQIADTRAGVPELVHHYQYWVDCGTGEVTETTLTYQQGALRLFVSVLAEYEDSFLVQSGCRQISAAGDGSTASDNGDAVILPVYSVISKSDYFSNNPIYREIQTAEFPWA